MAADGAFGSGPNAPEEGGATENAVRRGPSILRLLLHLGLILIGKRKKEKKKRAALYVANDETPTSDFAKSRNRSLSGGSHHLLCLGH